MNKKAIQLVVVLLLGAMLALTITSMWNDAATMDEGPHISAGYTYLRFLDMRINPEHPPLIKDLAGLPLQFLKLNFQTDHLSWKTNINDQWTTGPVFFYESGNNADKIIRTARLGVIWLLILLGFFIFKFARRIYGTRTALLSLFLYAFSPTFLAHGRYVTTDVGASLGFFIGILFFLEYLKKRTLRSVIFSGLALGTALLLKFSTFLLIPILAFLTFLAAVINWQPHNSSGQRWTYWRNSRKLAGGLLFIFVIAGLLIWLIYIPHVWNYPQERQYQDSAFILSSFGSRFLVDIQLKMTQIPMLRPIAQYLLGLFMVMQRAVGGNTTYFLGEVSAAGWRYYFPVVFFVKEQIVLHILIILSLFLAIVNFWKNKKATKTTVGKQPGWARFKLNVSRFKTWLNEYPNFVTFSALIFIAIYWGNSIYSNLNIGVRHILPTLPFIYLLVSRQMVKWFELPPHQASPIFKPLQAIAYYFKTYLKTALKALFLGILAVWYFLSAILVYPFYLAYFNELVGGPANGHKYVVDSNLDWGQDLKRLADFVEQNNIDHIKIDYFGSGSPRYYLGDKFEPWSSGKGPTKGWIAISATFLMGSVGKPAPGFQKDPQDDYSWLYNQKPVAQIGYSIFVYNAR